MGIKFGKVRMHSIRMLCGERNLYSLIFMLGGLILIGVSFFGKKIRKKFISESFVIPGIVVDIKEDSHKMADGNSRTFLLPIIEYKVKSKLRFEAEIDATQHKIKIGDAVEVLVSKSNYKIAKLNGSTKDLFLNLNIMLFLGVGTCGVSVHLFNPNDFSLDFIKDPFTAVVVVAGIIFFILKAIPVIRLYFYNGQNYTENAYEEPDADA